MAAITEAASSTSVIDRRSALPAWAQVVRDLRQTIARGMQAGDRLPSENALSARYGVSRITIRQALSALEDEGAIERRQGSGTFVSESNPHVTHDLTISEPWRARFEREGHSAGSTQIAAGTAALPSGARKGMGLDAATKVTLLRRVHVVDGTPIGVVDSWVSLAAAPGIDAEPLLNGSLTDTLRERYGITFSKAEGWMSVEELRSEDAQILESPAGTSAFVVEEILRDGGGRALAFSVTRWRGSGVRFRFATEF